MQESPQQLMPIRSRRRLFAVVTAILLLSLLAGALWAMRTERAPDDLDAQSSFLSREYRGSDLLSQRLREAGSAVPPRLTNLVIPQLPSLGDERLMRVKRSA